MTSFMNGGQMKDKKLYITLGSLMFVASIALGISPGLAKIGMAFPDVSNSYLQMILSFAAFSSFLASLLIGKVQDFISQRSVVLFGVTLLSIGVLPLFISNSFPLLLVVSILVGFGSGTMTSILPALIANYFGGEKRSAMLGANVSIQSIGSMSMTTLGGVLAGMSWQYNYGIFIVGVLSLIMGFLFLPKKTIEDNSNIIEENKDEKETEKYDLFNLPVIGLICLGACITLFSGCSQNNLALHAERLHIGTTAIVGLALSFQSLGSIIGGVSLTPLSKFTKKITLTICYFSIVIGDGVITLIHEPVALLVGCFCIGFGVGSLMTRLLYLMTSVVKKKAIAKVSATFSAATSIGFAISPLVFNFIAGFISKNLSTTSFFIVTTCSLIVTLILIVTRFESKIQERI